MRIVKIPEYVIDTDVQPGDSHVAELFANAVAAVTDFLGDDPDEAGMGAAALVTDLGRDDLEQLAHFLAARAAYAIRVLDVAGLATIDDQLAHAGRLVLELRSLVL